MATDLPRGPGSANPSWTPPQVAPVAPGLQQQPEMTSLEKLKLAVGSLTGGLTSVLNAAARTKQGLDGLKTQALDRIDRDLRSQAQSFQARRLAGQRKEMLTLSVEAENRGPAWLAGEARSRFENANSAEEQELWQGMFVAAQRAAKAEEADAERDSEMRIQQQFSLASHTAHNIITQLGSTLQLDAELRAQLIGDGKGIHSRVQDWVLSEVTAALPDAFVFGPRDPMVELKKQQRELLTAALLGESSGIADGLVREAADRNQRASFDQGVRQIDSDIYSFLTSDPDVTKLTESTAAVFDEQLNHLPETQKNEVWKKRATDALRGAAQGQLGTEMGSILSRMETILNMKVGNTDVFTPIERADLTEAVLESARQTSARLFDSSVAEAISKMSFVATDSLGNNVTVSDPNAILRLGEPDANGLSPVDQIANSLIVRMGLADKAEDDMSFAEWLISGEIRGRASDMNRTSREALQRRHGKQENYVSVQAGLPNADINDAYAYSPITRLISGNGLTAQESSSLRSAVIEASQQMFGGIPEDVASFNGAVLPPRTPENRNLRRAMATVRAAEWSNPTTAEEYGLPKGFGTEVKALLTSGDPEKVFDAVAYASALRSEGVLEDLLTQVSAGGETQVGAALLYATLLSQGQLAGPGEGIDQNIALQVQNILAAGPLEQYLAAPARNEKAKVTNSRVIYVSTINALQQSAPDLKFPDPNRFTDSQLADIFAAALPDGNATARDVLRIGQAFAVNHPNADSSTLGVMVVSFLNNRGLKMHVLNDRPITVFDPDSHLGEQGKNLNRKVSTFGIQPLGPEVRNIIGEMLDLSPADIPLTMAELYLRENKDLFEGTKADKLTWSVDFGVTTAGRERLSQPAAAGGGAIITVRHPTTGQLLPPIVSRKAVTVELPDGERIYLPPGTPVTTYSVHHTAEEFRSRPRGRFARVLN